MCGRSSLSKKEKDLEIRFGAKFYSDEIDRYNPLPNYNVHTPGFAPIIKNTDPEHFRYLNWGIDVTSHKGEVYPNIPNARAESIARIPLFADCLANRRCIMPATSYFEWKEVKGRKKKIPYLIHLKSLEVFSLGGLWVEQEDPQGNKIEKFVLITQVPNKKLSFIHDRMPFILDIEMEKKWLDPNTSAKEALAMIRPHPDKDIEFFTVTDELNKSFDNDPKFLQPVSYRVEEQGSLF